jgi:fimbrial chaperone protein
VKTGGLWAALWLCAGLACAGGSAAAQDVPALELAPIMLNLTQDKPDVLYIANRSTAPVTVQIEAYAWSQIDGVDRLSPTDSLLVSPPLTNIAPGERQIVRVLADRNEGAGETAYRLLVSQIPSNNRPSGQVKVLLQFSLPVFVGGAQAQPAALGWRARLGDGEVTLIAHNGGGKAVKLTGMHIAANGAAMAPSGSTSIAYILSGADHIWHLPVRGAMSATLSVSAKDERSGAAVAADVPVEH